MLLIVHLASWEKANLSRMSRKNSRPCVYWIHRLSQSDPAREGYVGIANNYLLRAWNHGRQLKHGSHPNPKLQHAFNKAPGEIVVERLFVGGLSECIALEQELRPKAEVAWNLLPGGGMPPPQRGLPWFTDGIKNVKSLSCPKGFWAGKSQKSGPGHGLSGKPKSAAHRMKLSHALTGSTHSLETRQKLARILVGRSKPSVKCPHCDVVGGAPAMARWHFHNCRKAIRDGIDIGKNLGSNRSVDQDSADRDASPHDQAERALLAAQA